MEQGAREEAGMDLQRETGVPHVWEVSTFGGYLLDRIGIQPPVPTPPARPAMS